ncbi:MAG: FkbM family methyltransferase [Chloroflexi bacterium]|nr:MAG: FkbM family methyltransferase [Chloroflexota bacterium]
MTTRALLADHVKRVVSATKGFGWLGLAWLPVWLAYAVSPLLRLGWPGLQLRFGTFKVRTRSADLYCFANVFHDYDVDALAGALETVEQVVDAGANVGAFSFLVTRLSRRHGHELPVIAIEPEPSNYAFLSEQPFARDLRCLRMAIGAQSGAGRLLRGANSATHQVVLDNGAATGDESVPIVTLESICTKRTLLKMDIEGGEWSVLAAGLPAQVVALFLECHAGGPSTDPRALINEGRWTPLSADLYGSSTWFWSR